MLMVIKLEQFVMMGGIVLQLDEVLVPIIEELGNGFINNKMGLFYTLLSLLFLFSCSHTDSKIDEKQSVPSEMDTLSNSVDPESNSAKKITFQTEQKQIKSKIEQKYGKQLDFCSCIQFHDSLNNAAQKDLSDQQIEKLLYRWDEMEIQCKELVNTNHRTPEDRLKHERKVKKCLNKK